MIVVTGSVTARKDSLDEVTRLSLEHVHRSRKEPGCISHAVHVDCENTLRLVFFEQWADRAALLAHFAVPASRPIRIGAAAARCGGGDPGALRRHQVREIVAHSWIATGISYCNAT
jgi:quinol monooxygenase YgiN